MRAAVSIDSWSAGLFYSIPEVHYFVVGPQDRFQSRLRRRRAPLFATMTSSAGLCEILRTLHRTFASMNPTCSANIEWSAEPCYCTVPNCSLLQLSCKRRNIQQSKVLSLRQYVRQGVDFKRFFPGTYHDFLGLSFRILTSTCTIRETKGPSFVLATWFTGLPKS